jgi:methionyl-tRNA formyltransferase
VNDTHPTVVFMGSPDFALPSLEALYRSGRYAPSLVVSQPDRPRGRGRKIVPTPVRAYAVERGTPTDVMSRKNYAEVVTRIAALEPDVVVVVAFGIILKRDLLDLPRLGCVNVHASLLPRHRGVSPIQAAILSGDAVTGCTTMRIDEGIDTGDVLMTRATDVRPDDTAGKLSDRLASMGGELLVRTLDGLFDGTLAPTPQREEGATYTGKLKKTDGVIDWRRSAEEIERHIRAMTPWPSAYTHVGDARGARLIVGEAREVRATGEPGTVVTASPLVVACGEGALEIVRLRPEGGRMMSAEAFLSGHPLQPGSARFR